MGRLFIIMGFVQDTYNVYKEINGQKLETVYTPTIYAKQSIVEKLKAEVIQPGQRQMGMQFKHNEVAHPFPFSTLQKLYASYGFVTGAVDKHVDFIVGSGFFVMSEDPRAEEVITQWLRDVCFDTILRAWLKTAIVTGNGFLEVGVNQEGIPTEQLPPTEQLVSAPPPLFWSVEQVRLPLVWTPLTLSVPPQLAPTT